VATDGKSAATAAGMVCPKCGVDLAAEVTIRAALGERDKSKEKDLAALRVREAEGLVVGRQAEAAAAKVRLEEAERGALEEQRVLDEMRQKVRESQVRAAQCEAEWRHSQDRVARMAAEVDMLRAEAAGAR